MASVGEMRKKALWGEEDEQNVRRECTESAANAQGGGEAVNYRNPIQREWDERRQSAPKPTAGDYAAGIGASGTVGAGSIAGSAAQGMPQGAGVSIFHPTIGENQVREAYQTLLKYKQGKANLERRIVEDEQWYKMRHWECMHDKKEEVQPTSAWLFNCIANKHADAMDNYPAPNILPREEGDKGEAEMLTSIVPVILQQNDFEQVYSDVWTYKLKTGTGVYGVFWDKEKLSGMGDVTVKKIDLINLFWESGITDIQQSRNVFHAELCDNDILIAARPELEGKLGSTFDVSKYVYDDAVDTSDKSVVIDWYYKKSAGGKAVLHYCKFVNDVVLYASENDPEYADRGWYDHGMYPFVFDPLFTVEGTPAGFGYIDIAKDAQTYIDRANQALMQNMLANARPRYFIRDDGDVNEAEFADMTKDFVHVGGNLGQDSVQPITGARMPEIYVTLMQSKIDELKETTGNRDISTGGTTSGVTAASAIAAMQEAGSKLSRDANKAAYRAFRRMCIMVIELIRQFYDLPRCFRIMGERGSERYVMYSNAGIKPQPQGDFLGMDLGDRVPLFDIEVSAEKASPYSKMAQNELALQFYGAGFFNPQLADQALACLDMMDFDRKESIMQKIAENGGMYQQMMAMQQQIMMLTQMVDDARGTNIAGEMAAGAGGRSPAGGAAPGGGKAEISEGGAGESSVTKNARQRTADATAPK